MFFWPTTRQPVTSRSGAITHRGLRTPTFSNWQQRMERNSPRSTLAFQVPFSFPPRLQKADDRPQLRSSSLKKPFAAFFDIS